MRGVLALTGAALTTVAAFSQTPAAPRPSVGVFLDFDSLPSKTSVEMMKKEVGSLLKPSGISVDWRLTEQNRGRESFNGLVVLKFKGKCRVEAWSTDSPLPEPGSTETLGTTQVSEGRVLPFSEVQCDALQQALLYLRPETNLVERQQAFGLALGRVVAHELYHILAGTTKHAAQGLARAAESLRDLVGVRAMPFRSEDAEAIRKGLVR